MVTVIMVLTPIGLESNISEIKEALVKYLGIRLVKDNPSNKPLIHIIGSLPDSDKLEISRIVKAMLETAAIFYIEAENEKWMEQDTNFITLNPIA